MKIAINHLNLWIKPEHLRHHFHLGKPWLFSYWSVPFFSSQFDFQFSCADWKLSLLRGFKAVRVPWWAMQCSLVHGAGSLFFDLDSGNIKMSEITWDKEVTQLWGVLCWFEESCMYVYCFLDSNECPSKGCIELSTDLPVLSCATVCGPE